MCRPSYQPVIELTRGKIVESIHYGAMAVVDAQGQLLASYGDPSTVTFLRSSAKPFQALPFVEGGGDLAYQFTPKELAVICSSHSGTDEHMAVVQGLQKRLGVGVKDMLCGAHPPFHEPTAFALKVRGEDPSPLRHNCSGKHTGMLAHCLYRHLPIEDYVNIDHPVQQIILKAFAEMCSLAPEQVEVGIDGCSVPTFAVPLYNAALAYARLAEPSGLAPERAAACRRITAAMTGNPFMVAGPDRFDTDLMEALKGRVLAKMGAEGYQGMCLMPGALGPGSPALGIAFKVSDGDLTGRACPCMALEVLRELGAISRQEMQSLAEYGPRPIYNWRRLTVGEIRPVFALEKNPAEAALTGSHA